MFKRYHCLEILNNVTRNVTVTDLKLISANYTAEGLTSVVEDQYNKQKYRLSITPIKEESRNEDQHI